MSRWTNTNNRIHEKKASSCTSFVSVDWKVCSIWTLSNEQDNRIEYGLQLFRVSFYILLRYFVCHTASKITNEKNTHEFHAMKRRKKGVNYNVCVFWIVKCGRLKVVERWTHGKKIRNKKETHEITTSAQENKIYLKMNLSALILLIC